MFTWFSLLYYRRAWLHRRIWKFSKVMKNLKQYLNREKNFALTPQFIYNKIMHQGCSATGDDLCNCKETPEAPLITGLLHGFTITALLIVVKKCFQVKQKLARYRFCLVDISSFITSTSWEHAFLMSCSFISKIIMLCSNLYNKSLQNEANKKL